MNIYLNSEVYLVKGKSGGVLYDFSRGELFHISKEATDLIDNLPVDDKKISEEAYGFLEKLKRIGLVTDRQVGTHKIEDLKNRKPIDFVWIEVTTGCNLKCIHCYDEASCHSIKFMSYEDFCHVVDELQINGIKKIQLIGGEPLLLKEKLKIYLDYCIGKFEYIEVFTNGTLLNEELVEYFSKNDIKVALSVYSYKDENHDRVTGVKGSYQKTNQAIELLHKNKVTYRVKNVLMRDIDLGNKNTTLYSLSKERDVARLTGRANMKLLNEELIEKRLITEETFSGNVRKQVILRNLSGHNCFSRRLYFSVDLTVYPCVMERRVNHGNLKTQKLKDILKEELMGMNKDHINGCKDCEYRYSCHDCRPDSYGKGVQEKPWYCTYDPQIGIWQDKNQFAHELLKRK